MDAKFKSTVVRIDLRVALLYALFGGLWILLSDRLLASFITDTSALSTLQTYKGWVFVALSSLLIFIQLRRELTLRRIAEGGLRESEEQYRLLFENSIDAILLSEMDGTAYAANPAACRMLGWTEAEFKQIRREDIADTTDSRLQSAVEERALTGSFHGELMFVRKDGTKFPAEVSSTAFVDKGGNTQTSTVLRDISKRKKAEAALQKSEQDMQALLISLDDVIFQFDGDGTYLNIWATDESLLVRPKAEMLGHRMEDVLGSELGRTATETVKRVIASGQPESIEYALDVMGGRRWFTNRISPVLGADGSYQTASMLIRDITERKQAEDDLRTLNAELEQRVAKRTQELTQMNAELEHASRAKDEFLANMSHELRTPLNSILGLSESLLEQRRDPLTESQQNLLQIIESSGHHLLGLINDILDLSKIEAGRFDFYPQPISVDDLCRSSLPFIKAQATKKSISVLYTNEASVSRIFADPRRLKQILVNLLTNAVKFSHENGTVTLQVACDPMQELIRFSVIDNGIGITPEDLQRLFQPFVQLDSGLNRQYDGTGLGLTLVQKLTDLHGGSVSVESEPGKGSCFTISLACKLDEITKQEALQSQADLSVHRQSKTAEIPLEASAPRRVILLAEDSQPNILTIGEYVEDHGYEVVVAHDGLEAITKAEEVNPDLILMDIQMPVMNGLEAIAHLRADWRFASTPIVALTALAMPGDRERCLQVGATEYMSKPVSLKTLLKVIEKLTNSHK